jgi:hypothetical protein
VNISPRRISQPDSITLLLFIVSSSIDRFILGDLLKMPPEKISKGYLDICL